MDMRSVPHGEEERSPSVRRAWIEIMRSLEQEENKLVTLREEGVD